MGLYNDLLLIRTLYLVPFARYLASKISFCDLDLSGSPKVKYFNFFGKPIGNFIKVLCCDELSIAYRLRDIRRHTSDDLAGNPTFDLLKVIDLNWFFVSINLLLALSMRFKRDMLRWCPFYRFICAFIYSAKSLEILNRAWNNMGKFSKYFSTLRSHISVTLQPNEPNKCPLELYLLLYMSAKNQLDCLISSTTYVMDNAYLCLGRRKTKKRNLKKRI